jgi:hypothetical protein
MRGLKTIRSLRIVAAGHAFVQILRRGRYELTADVRHMSGCTWRTPHSRPAFEIHTHGRSQRRHALSRVNATEQAYVHVVLVASPPQSGALLLMFEEC